MGIVFDIFDPHQIDQNFGLFENNLLYPYDQPSRNAMVEQTLLSCMQSIAPKPHVLRFQYEFVNPRRIPAENGYFDCCGRIGRLDRPAAADSCITLRPLSQ